jgi:importin subunit alpha-6/7
VSILAGDEDPQRKSILAHRPFPALRDLLLSEGTDLASFVCEALTSILALGQEHVEAVIQHQMIPVLVGLLVVENLELFLPALKAIRAVVSHGTTDQIRVLVDHGCVLPLCDFLTLDPAEDLYPDIVDVLDVLGNILRAGAGRRGANPAADEVVEEGGLENLRELRQHDHPQVRAGSIAILHTYFGDDDDDDDDEEEEESGAGSESDASGDEDDGEEEIGVGAASAASGEADGDDDGEEPPLQRPRMA